VKEKKEKQLLAHESDIDSEAVSSSQRAAVYSNWIVEKFGLDWLKEGRYHSGHCWR